MQKGILPSLLDAWTVPLEALQRDFRKASHVLIAGRDYQGALRTACRRILIPPSEGLWRLWSSELKRIRLENCDTVAACSTQSHRNGSPDEDL